MKSSINRLQLVVAEQPQRCGETRVEHRIGDRGDRLGPFVQVGFRKAARVGQLQPDIEISVRAGAESIAMRRDQLLAQPRDRRQRARRQQQLMRIGAAVMADRHGLAAPDQLRAALAEILPAAGRQVARFAVGRAVPAFHRQHAEAIADADIAQLKGLAPRRTSPAGPARDRSPARCARLRDAGRMRRRSASPRRAE